VKAEQQDQKRSHERASADAGEADQRTDEEPGKRIKRIVGGKDRCPLAQVTKPHKIEAFSHDLIGCFAEPPTVGKGEGDLADGSAFICGGRRGGAAIVR